jgi:glycosyltransferase involved in cell wall biosynthesis
VTGQLGVESGTNTRSHCAALKLSVIIPAFNEERLLGQTLREVQASLAPLTALGWTTELIVCDNNSTDRSAQIAREAGATVVFEPQNQIARARNRGAAAATGDWLLFIDADSHPSPELVRDVAEAIQSGRYLAGGATIRFSEDHPLASFLTRFWNGLSRTRRLLAGSFIFCEAQAFRNIGGFSGELFAGEELDLSTRLKKLGRETGKKIVILHRHPLVTSARKMKLYSGRELVWFFLRAAFRQKATLTDRAACHPWYDGRR